MVSHLLLLHSSLEKYFGRLQVLFSCMIYTFMWLHNLSNKTYPSLLFSSQNCRNWIQANFTFWAPTLQNKGPNWERKKDEVHGIGNKMSSVVFHVVIFYKHNYRYNEAWAPGIYLSAISSVLPNMVNIRNQICRPTLMKRNLVIINCSSKEAWQCILYNTLQSKP